jgi:hypothetical protein
MMRNALLGFLVVAFCVAGIVAGIARVAPGRSAVDLGLAAVAAALGAAAFTAVLRRGHRGTPPWARWLIVPVVIAAFYLDRLSPRWQLAVLALAGGYVVAFLATIIARVARMPR